MKKDGHLKEYHTIPEGSYEAGIINDRSKGNKKRDPNEITTDLQGNGYPVKNSKK